MRGSRDRLLGLLLLLIITLLLLGGRGRVEDVVHLVDIHGDLHLVVVLTGQVAGVLLPELSPLLSVSLELGLLFLELGLETLQVGLLGLQLSLKLGLLCCRQGFGGLDVLLQSLDEGLVRVDLGLDVGDFGLVSILHLELLVQESLVGLGGLMGSLLLGLLNGLGVKNGLTISNGVTRHLLVGMQSSDVVLDLHHLALQNLEGILEGQDLLVKLGSLLGSETSLLLLVHVDLVELLLGKELKLGKGLLKSKLVGNIGLVVPAVLCDLGLKLSLKLLGVSDGLDFLLEVRNLGLQSVGLSGSASGGSVSSSNSGDSGHRGHDGLATLLTLSFLLEHGEVGLALEVVAQAAGNPLGKLSLLLSLSSEQHHSNDSGQNQGSGSDNHLHVGSPASGLLRGLHSAVLLGDIEPDRLFLRHL
mmetsp:Transcript_41378/g.64626  ORF Transcript_41378/g.64626 Transcript_41378/m.64626 type:complete len:416 (+) Transcript_41378:208-1455(+)